MDEDPKIDRALKAAKSLIERVENGQSYYLNDEWVWRPYLPLDTVDEASILIEAALNRNEGD